MATSQQEWQEFIDKMESGLSDARQNVDNIINDGTATEEQKRNAASDYAKQSLFLQQVQGMYDNGDYDNPTNTFGVNGTGAVYLSYKDNKYHSLTLAPWVYNGDITEGDKITAQVMTSDEISLVSTLEDIWSGTKTVTGWETQRIDDVTLYVGCTFGVGTYGTGFHATLVDANDYFSGVDLAQYTRGPQGVFAGVYIPGYSGAPQGTLIRDTFSGTSQSRGYWSSGNGIYAGYATIIEIQPEEMENPWDYYNDNILPDIDPDNAAFPDGYEPSSPHDPPEEPDMDSSDEGDAPEYDPTTIVTAPSLFITQYVLNESLLRSLGETLWQSWLTPNTDIWENFLWDFASQTGTFNITAALDYIISLRVYPFDLHAIINPIPPEGFYGHSDGVYMGTGKTNFTYSSGITNVITINSVNGYMNLGECVVKSTDAPFNDFRDMFNSSISCYLPFCGTIELNPVDVYGRKLRCSYFIDFQSGGCTALVECEGDTGWFPVGCKSGQMGFTLPLTATNAGQLAATFASDAVQAVGTLSGLYFNVGRSAANVASAIATKNVEASNTAMTAMNMGQSTVNAGLSLASQAMGIMSRSGVDMPLLSGGTGCETLAMYRRPFITIRRGKYAKPANFPHSVAYKNGTSSTISNYHGMTQFIGVDTTGLTCHDDEKEEILSLLQSGVYLP